MPVSSLLPAGRVFLFSESWAAAVPAFPPSSSYFWTAAVPAPGGAADLLMWFSSLFLPLLDVWPHGVPVCLLLHPSDEGGVGDDDPSSIPDVGQGVLRPSKPAPHGVDSNAHQVRGLHQVVADAGRFWALLWSSSHWHSAWVSFSDHSLSPAPWA